MQFNLLSNSNSTSSRNTKHIQYKQQNVSNTLYTFYNKKTLSPSSKTNPFYNINNNNNDKYNNNNNFNKFLPKLKTQTHSKQKSFSSLNDDLTSLYTLWNDLGVTRNYRNVFESYYHTIPTKDKLNLINIEKSNLIKVNELYSSLSNEIQTRKEQIANIKENINSINTAYFEDKDDIDNSLVTSIQNNINQYRIHTINIIKYVIQFKELTEYYVHKNKFDFHKCAFPYINNNYLSNLKYDIDFIYKSEQFNKYFHTKSKEPKDALLSNLPTKIEYNNNSNTKKYCIQLNNELIKQINETKYILAQEMMFHQIEDEKKSRTLSSATYKKIRPDSNSKTLTRSSSAFYSNQFKNRTAQPWNTNNNNLSPTMHNRLEEMYKLYAVPSPNMYLRQFNVNGNSYNNNNQHLSVTLHKLKENSKNYNSMFMNKNLKFKKRGNEDEMLKVAYSSKVRKPQLIKDENDKDKDLYADGVEVVDNKNNEIQSNNIDDKNEDYNNKPTLNNNFEVKPLSIKYDSFYNKSFNSYFSSISERQKQLFNISTPSLNLLGAYPQVLIITPNNKENDLPQGICIYYKEYQMKHKLPNIIIDQLSSLNESNLSEFITLFIMYIKNNNKDYNSIIIKINLNEITSDIVNVLENDLHFKQINNEYVFTNKTPTNKNTKNMNILSLKSFIVLDDNDNTNNDNNDIEFNSNKYMNSLLHKELMLLNNNNNHKLYNNIVSINTVNNKNKDYFNSIYKTITNTNPPSTTKSFSITELIPLITNIISLKHNGYYYNKITPPSTIQTFNISNTNHNIYLLSFSNCGYSIMIYNINKTLQSKLLDNTPTNIYEYFSNEILPKLTKHNKEYTSIYLPSFQIDTHLTHDNIDEYINVNLNAENTDNNIIIDLPSTDDNTIIIKDTFIFGTISKSESTLIPIQLYIISKDAWVKCV